MSREAVDGPVGEYGVPGSAIKPMAGGPCGRDDESPVHRLDSRPRAMGGRMPTNRIPALCARLARLALEVDELAQQIIAEPLTERDGLGLASPTAHLVVATEWLKQALYECDRLDLTQSWGAWLRDERKEPIMRTPKVTRSLALRSPPIRGSRQEVFGRVSPRERVALMRAGVMTNRECCRRAARAPHEVPIVNAECEVIAGFAPEAAADSSSAASGAGGGAGYARGCGASRPDSR
jgi:hypothetical protein